MLVAGLDLEQVERVLETIAPVTEYPGRGGASVKIWRAKHALEKRFVYDIVRLRKPKCFHKIMLILWVLGIQLPNPLLQRRDDLFRIAPAQFNPGTRADAVFRFAQQVQQVWNRLARDSGRLQHRPI